MIKTFSKDEHYIPTLSYILALTLIALLTVFTFFVLQIAFTEQKHDSALINDSGRQRMLSQRTALSATRLVTAPDAEVQDKAREDLASALNLMRVSHEYLSGATSTARLEADLRPLIHDAYFGGDNSLDTRIRSYFDNLDRLLEARASELSVFSPPYLAVMAQIDGALLSDLDAVVQLYEEVAKSNLRKSESIHAMVVAITLLLLVVEGLFIFRPLVTQIKRKISDLEAANQRITELAVRDSLTQLPNRSGFGARLEDLVKDNLSEGKLAAVMQLDLDRFKNINDTLGHPIGDKVLIEVGKRVESVLGRRDQVARLGGDEFAVIAKHLHSPKDAAQLADNIIHAVAAPMELDGHRVQTNTSIGITMFPDDDTDTDQLLKNADIALYQAKNTGRGTFSFFISSMKDEINYKKRLSEELRQAIASDQLEVYTQPIRSLRSHSIELAETLIRWNHPERGVVPAADFIEVADEFLLVAQIDKLVISKVLAQLVEWRDRNIPAPRMTINMSPRQLKTPNFAKTLAREIDTLGLSRRAVCVEVLETVLIGRGCDDVAQNIADLKKLGIDVLLDDFGTGYASLTHLADLPVSTLKIDKSFIQGIANENYAKTIVTSVISMARSLNIETIAEGVESPEQLVLLQGYQCNYVQGHYFDKAMPLAALEALLTADQKTENSAGASPDPDEAIA